MLYIFECLNQHSDRANAEVVEHTYKLYIRFTGKIANDASDEQAMIRHMETIQMAVEIAARYDLIERILLEKIGYILVAEFDERELTPALLLPTLFQQFI